MDAVINESQEGGLEVTADTNSVATMVDVNTNIFPGIVYRAYIGKGFSDRNTANTVYHAIGTGAPVAVDFRILDGNAYDGTVKMTLTPMNGDPSKEEIQRVKLALERLVQ